MPLRPARVAGRFYPDAPSRLEHDIRQYLEAAEVSAAPERTAGIIVPHAGYPYSGPVAAHAFKRLAGKRPDRAILLGRSHHFAFQGASVFTSGAFETPLGFARIDEEFANDLARDVETWTLDAHEPEHALEVELPFLQVVLGECPIVPILFGDEPGPWHEAFGRTLAGRLEPQDLVIVSTDLSHYLQNDEAHSIDRKSLDCLLRGDVTAYSAAAVGGEVSMCGATAVVVGMACAQARGASEWQLLDYRTSGDVCGEKARVVGYAALSMEYPE